MAAWIKESQSRCRTWRKSLFLGLSFLLCTTKKGGCHWLPQGSQWQSHHSAPPFPSPENSVLFLSLPHRTFYMENTYLYFQTSLSSASYKTSMLGMNQYNHNLLYFPWVSCPWEFSSQGFLLSIQLTSSVVQISESITISKVYPLLLSCTLYI